MHPQVHAANDPDRAAIVMAETGEVRTYGQLVAAANRYARLFRDLGIETGDHVAFCVENTIAYPELLWAAHYAGLFYTACSTRLTAEELAYIVDDCDARLLVLSSAFEDLAPDVLARTPRLEMAFSLGGPVAGLRSLEDEAAAMPDTPLENQLVAGRDMLYSSGTTGRPKGIRPRALDKTFEDPMILTPTLIETLHVTADSTFLIPAPLYHSAPLRHMMGVLQIGGTVVLMRKFDAAAALAAAERLRVSHALLVPTMFVRLLRLPAEVRAAADLSALQGIVHGGGPCPVDVKQAMIDWVGPILQEFYGSTEASGLTWCTSQEWLTHVGSVGRAVVGRLHIVDDDGNELPPGETGRVAFSDGPTFMYHKDEAKTREAIDDRGWSRYGDIGHLDEDGYLYLTDRESFLVVSGGVNIYPQEIEDVLLSHPAVLDAAVFGIPDPEYGEAVHAAVQPVDPEVDPAALEDELRAYCRSRLAGYKCPRRFHVRADLPRHDTGKLYKRQLQEEYASSVPSTGIST